MKRPRGIEIEIDPAFLAKLQRLGAVADQIFNGVPVEARKVGYLLMAFPIRDDDKVNCNFVTNLTPGAVIELVEIVNSNITFIVRDDQA